MLVRLHSWIVVEQPGGNLEHSWPPGPFRARIRHRRAASAAERYAIGGRRAQYRRFVGGDQLFARDEAEVLDAHIESRKECGAGDFAASRAMAQLERTGRFREFEPNRAAETTSMDHSDCSVSSS